MLFLHFGLLLTLSLKFVQVHGCTCAVKKYPCYENYGCEATSKALCKGEYCEWKTCTVAHCLECEPKGDKCISCKAPYINWFGLCKTKKDAFKDVKTKVVQNQILMSHKDLYARLKLAFKTGRDREDALKMVVDIFHYIYGDKVDLAIVWPYEKLSGNGIHGEYFPWANKSEALNGFVTINPGIPGLTKACELMHELGHNWLVYGITPNQAWKPHWGITALNKKGQLGGYQRSAIKCKTPANREPSPTQPCTKNKDGKIEIQINHDGGEPATSDDTVGAFAYMELYIMGLLREIEIKDEYITYCEITKKTFDSSIGPGADSLTCDKLHFYTTKNITKLVNTSKNTKRMKPSGPHSQHLKIASIIVNDLSVLPSKIDSKSPHSMSWIEQYVQAAPLKWSLGTYKRSTINFDIYAKPPTEAPTKAPTRSPTEAPTRPGATKRPTTSPTTKAPTTLSPTTLSPTQYPTVEYLPPPSTASSLVSCNLILLASLIVVSLKRIIN